jgi:predicted RNA binding protein YcfA (HicA-like mRNA interferase family)
MDRRKLLKRLAITQSNVKFDDLRSLVQGFGFRLSRVNGSHHIFVHPAIDEMVNLQKVGSEAKPYQVRQFLSLVERHNLQMGDDE